MESSSSKMIRKYAMETNKIFATAINCMDGRVQIPVIERING